MNIEREFEKIDETKGISKDGEYLSAVPLRDGVFEK
jgi:hypothetical protein